MRLVFDRPILRIVLAIFTLTSVFTLAAMISVGYTAILDKANFLVQFGLYGALLLFVLNVVVFLISIIRQAIDLLTKGRLPRWVGALSGLGVAAGTLAALIYLTPVNAVESENAWSNYRGLFWDNDYFDWAGVSWMIVGLAGGGLVVRARLQELGFTDQTRRETALLITVIALSGIFVFFMLGLSVIDWYRKAQPNLEIYLRDESVPVLGRIVARAEDGILIFTPDSYPAKYLPFAQITLIQAVDRSRPTL